MSRPSGVSPSWWGGSADAGASLARSDDEGSARAHFRGGATPPAASRHGEPTTSIRRHTTTRPGRRRREPAGHRSPADRPGPGGSTHQHRGTPRTADRPGTDGRRSVDTGNRGRRGRRRRIGVPGGRLPHTRNSSATTSTPSDGRSTVRSASTCSSVGPAPAERPACGLHRRDRARGRPAGRRPGCAPLR